MRSNRNKRFPIDLENFSLDIEITLLLPSCWFKLFLQVEILRQYFFNRKMKTGFYTLLFLFATFSTFCSVVVADSCGFNKCFPKSSNKSSGKR